MQAQTRQAAEVAEAAGFWRRFAGAFIDGLVLSIVGYVLRLVLGAAVGELLSLAVGAAYFTWFHGSTGQTPGNAALGIRVVDIDRGETLDYGRALARWAVSIVSAVVILLGYFWMLWDPRKQTWHDKAANSLPVVVRR